MPRMAVRTSLPLAETPRCQETCLPAPSHKVRHHIHTLTSPPPPCLSMRKQGTKLSSRPLHEISHITHVGHQESAKKSPTGTATVKLPQPVRGRALSHP